MASNLVNSDINTLTTEILILKQQTAQNIIEIGKRLMLVKENLPHGEWGKWLAEKVDFSHTSANRFMQVAKEFSNSPTLVNLPPSKVFALLDLPPEEREGFIQSNPVDEMSTRELQQTIKEKKDLEKKLKAAEKGAQAAEKLKKELDETKRQLSEAQASGNNEEAERLQESLEKTDGELTAAQVKIKELEQKLKDKPIEAVAAPIIERIPEEVQKELEELRKGQGQRDDAASLKFKIYFDELVSNFKNLLGSLDEVQKVDEIAYERYKNAVSGLLGKMSERL